MSQIDYLGSCEELSLVVFPHKPFACQVGLCFEFRAHCNERKLVSEYSGFVRGGMTRLSRRSRGHLDFNVGR